MSLHSAVAVEVINGAVLFTQFSLRQSAAKLKLLLLAKTHQYTVRHHINLQKMATETLIIISTLPSS